MTESEAAEMRAQLTRVALRIVDTEGRDACSLRRVGVEAGISRMTPYSYFADKEALLDAVRVAALHALSDACEAALREGATIADRLRGVGQAYVRFALTHPALYDLVYERHGGGPDHEQATARYRRLAESPLREAFSQGMVAIEPERLAHVLWAATHGVIGLHRAGKLNHGVAFEQVLQDLGDTLAFGFVPRSGGAQS
ncbi:TetR/AcrR family transcriptional regulator [Sorangium cellulosum]|uniref:TetR/AcrR family transcriptional regulator n=1 Tax=Sorangium cellulosum TaxID=56 RepID=UPI001331375E|nr:TetR/AcrR family transcriptional regulator [Sorangium cellulosum]